MLIGKGKSKKDQGKTKGEKIKGRKIEQMKTMVQPKAIRVSAHEDPLEQTIRKSPLVSIERKNKVV